ncbi:hypothetical protein LOTGIDRAFT_228498 [Lottia gigantea]|uniref:CAP-Gly domain-containing protein n=1 Tax=Lottia gigantea TaxID=225164 RepID=V4AJE9_LOTGI|nr:hypothetical protein LOTGIDRAFT_228498 [Lottia gigantea]ESO93686.1 hypothetical protein LOTGIDRAFT_228498 [Lottia gigantea]
MDYEAVNMATQFTSKIPGPGKKKSFLPAPVKTSSAPLPTKSPSPEPKDPFAIGDRVCIAGIKFGTLQYFGETHIAPGLWCGVELDEPEGNHDGMVQGRRYFTCEYKHGIFAPLDKVALLEEDIYFEDDYMDTGSELEEPVIARPKKSKHHSSESKIARSRSSHDADYSKSKIGRGSGIPKPGSKQRPLSYHSSSESLTQTSPIKTRSLKSVIKSQNSLEEDETNVPHPSKPSQIPGISRLPKYSQSSGSLVRSPSSSEHIVADITSPQSGESIISAEFIDDESYEIESENNSPRHQSPKRQASLGQSPEETYSNHVSVQLKSDSRHYLNLTFDPNEGGYVKSNLPDVVASTSPSPDNKEFGRDTYRDNVDGHGNVTLESCGSETLDSSRLDDINLLDSICDSKSDKKKRESLSVLSEQFDKLKLNNSPLTSKGNNSSATQDVSSSLKLSRDQFVNMEGDLVSDQMTCSNSQTLQQEVAPTMMKSLDDSSRKIMMDSGISEMSASQLTDSMTRSHQMDNIHGVLTKSTDMGKSVPISDQIVMTDSGIAGSYHRDANVGFVSNDVKLSEDLLAGHNKHERPVSLISTTSADTEEILVVIQFHILRTDDLKFCYVPDTDSECGTKTTNSPGEWPAERLGDQTSMTESQIIQYQDSFQASCISEEVKHIINAQISVDSDVSGTTHDTETDRESEVSETHITETLKLDPAQESRSLSSHNSEDDRIEADQISSDIDDNLGDKGLENNHDNHQHEQPSPGSENSGDVVSVVDNTEVLETATEEGGVSNDGKTPNNKTTSSKASPKHAVKTEHKKPNTKVSSRLADYINTPAPPPKPKEETPNKKNLMNKKNIDKTNEKNVANIQKTESCRKPKIEKEPPKIIKRSPPKSKWGSIMSQIESHKDDKPVKVKTEVKSKLQEYLSNPAPAPVRKEKTPKKESKPRSVITNSPKPDYSKVKSRLSVIAPPPKRDNSPSSRRGSKVEKGNLPTPGSAGSSKTDISLEVNANRTPRTSISTTISKLAAESRRSSVSSVRSDKSQGSTKAVNSKLSSRKNSTTESKIAAPRPPNKKLVKSSIPPAIRTPKKVLPTVNERSSKKDNSRSVSLTKTPKKASSVGEL